MRFNGWLRSLVFYRPPQRPPTPSASLSESPEPPRPLGHRHRALSHALAIALPVIVCLLIVPVRDDLDRSTAALILVLPVVVMALFGGAGPGAVAAITAPLGFDVLLTQPYYSLEMSVAQDLEAALILLAVGVLASQLVAQETLSRARAETRGRELENLVAVASATRPTATEAELVDRVQQSLTSLLELRECRWSPGYHGAAHPVLTRSGDVSGEWTHSPDQASLPDTGAEIPVSASGRELGRFVVVPAARRPISREERVVATVIADLFAQALVARHPK